MSVEPALKILLKGFVLPTLAVAFALCVFTREITIWRAIIGMSLFGIAYRLSIALSDYDNAESAGGASE